MTLTLPERTLQGLASIDPDRARAIVKATDAALGKNSISRARVELVEVGPRTSLIVVGYNRYLQRIPGLGLAELAPGRFILTVSSGASVDSLEIILGDIIDEVPPQDETDRATLDELRHLLRRFRRGQAVRKAEILVLETGSQPPGDGSRPPPLD